MAALEALHAHTAVYTAPSAVESLLDRIGWPDADGVLLDPGAGDGAFLVAAMNRLAPLPGDFAAAARVRGLEIHPGAAADARERLAGALAMMGWTRDDARRAAEVSVRNADFLIDGYDGPEPSFIAGNPPYMRFARLPQAFKDAYAAILPKVAKGDLQHAFLDRCAALLRPDGAIAFVTADRWLLNDGSAPLRAALGRTLGVDHVGRLDAASCFYRPKNRRSGTPPRVHPVEIVLRAAGVAEHALGADPFSPDGPAESWDGPVLADVATVRLAPYLGPVGGFLLDAGQSQAFDAERLVPALDLDDIDFDTGTVRRPTRFALLTDPAEEPTGVVRDHLLAALPTMPKKVREGRWWCPPEPVNRDLGRPALLIPRIAKGIRAVLVEGGVLPVNHNITVVTDERGTGLERLRDALTSDAAQEWVVRHAPRLEDGYHDIRTTLVRRIPLYGWDG